MSYSKLERVFIIRIHNLSKDGETSRSLKNMPMGPGRKGKKVPSVGYLSTVNRWTSLWAILFRAILSLDGRNYCFININMKQLEDSFLYYIITVFIILICTHLMSGWELYQGDFYSYNNECLLLFKKSIFLTRMIFSFNHFLRVYIFSKHPFDEIGIIILVSGGGHKNIVKYLLGGRLKYDRFFFTL